jgi:hypothetical protein
MEKETYKIEFTQDEIRELLYLCEFSFDKLKPFIPSYLIHFEDKLRKIILYGCFKHNRLRVRFQTEPRRTVTLCPQCMPKEYKKLKEEFTEEEI